jgi:FAD:protein FMN transferase
MLRLIFVLLLPVCLSAQLTRFEFSQNKMGSPFHLIFYHTDSAEATFLAKECFSIVDSLNAVFSDYDPKSEIGTLALQPIYTRLPVSEELFAMILRASQAFESSNRSFDITIGALTQLWRKAKAEARFPTDTEIKRAKGTTGFKNLVIQTNPNRILIRRPGMQFDFGGIVKGYAAQRMIDLLKNKHVSIALADAGGDIVVSNAPPGKDGWSIGINLPEQENKLMNQKLELKNCAVATSGDLYNYILHDGTRYSHIIDPRTGYGVTSQRNVTVIAQDGATADWLATACSILPVKKALALAKKENADLLITTLEKGEMVTYKTKNFDSHFQ